jgi:hypothetical protein
MSSRAITASIAACFALASVAHAQISVRAVTPLRWGTSAGSLGLGNAALESFEDTTLVPGLSVLWYAPAGNIGPVTTLPQTFNCATGDPFGTAFSNGAWDGVNGLVSARGNQTYSYGASQNWGDLELQFTTPQKVVGFSLQQADAEVTLVVNGVTIGGLGSLTGTPMNGGRIGYFVVTADGADSISTLKLDNTAGDGFVIDKLLFSTQPTPTVSVTGFSSAVWPRPDKELGITPVQTEDFEDTALVAGLTVGWETLAGSVTPAETLPQTFAPAAQDTFGDAFDAAPWDGTRCIINTRDNASHPYTGTGEWGDMILSFNPPRQSVAFSFEQAEDQVRLVVNGRDAGNLLALAGFNPALGRQGFVRIDTPCGGTPINEIRLNNTLYPAGGDGFAIDHLMFGAPISVSAGPSAAAICHGPSAAFSVTAAGLGPFTYQWQIETTTGNWMTLGNDPGPLPGGGAAYASPINSPSVHIGVLNRAGPFNVRCIVANPCGSIDGPSARLFINPADLGSQGGVAIPDGLYDNNDFVVFIDYFFNHDVRADLGRQGGVFGPDDDWDNNDFIVFIDQFFSGC